MRRPNGADSVMNDEYQQLVVLNEIARVGTLDIELRHALQRITTILHTRFAWEFVACLSIDREEGVLVCEALSTMLDTEFVVGRSRALQDDMLGRTAENRTPVLLDAASSGDPSIGVVTDVSSELCIPIEHGGTAIAVLHLGSTRWAAFRDQLPLLTAVASQVASAIASTKRLEALRAQASLTEMLSQVSRLATEATDLSEILERVVHYIAENFPVEIGSILLLDESSRKFIVEVYSGELELHTPGDGDWLIDVGVCGRAVRTGEPQLVLDTSQDSDYVPGHESVQAEYVLPIRFRDRILGVLNLESSDRETFTPYVQTVFRSLADQIAGAINLSSLNQRLLETNRIVEERTCELEKANQQLQLVNAKLERLSSMDGLTGVANRRRFDEVLDAEWRRAYRNDRPISAMLVDVDFFKHLNDTYGHQYGDDCLRKIAKALAKGLRRASDLIARYGGEEFAVILPETNADHALRHADRLRTSIEDLRLSHKASVVSSCVTVSIGVATLRPREVEQPDLLIQAADLALYQAKRSGRNRVVSRTLE